MKRTLILSKTGFLSSNKMFKAISVQLKREGKGGIDHHPPIEADDLKAIYASLKTLDPTSIHHKVFVDIMLYFGCQVAKTCEI